MSTAAVPPRRIWLLALGFGLWCTALVAIYALHAIGCVFAWPTEVLRWTLALVLVAHLAAIAWPWYSFAKTPADPAQGETGSFLQWTVVWTLATAFVALVLTLGPTLLVSTCV
jgi:hypothetical protein